ncbi:hypothetical protein JSE7799_01511 [Jannaschia seosinensis]|uniref:Uncharacterized protein n=1 Tax=Jannaschia seosinensis TaxID=313367 RepID=A0A0M7BAE4_9RHOB|nr:DUF6525 family protein [Jannaschia seosinensis]CUH38794.1 hypothetical protein JSE7799_01511 [Jannaschia seosinensis]
MTRRSDPRNVNPLRQMAERRRTMAEYDALPEALRGWLAEARLQWDPVSARRAWRRAMWTSMGRRRAALAYMDRLEAEALARDGLEP